MVFCSVHFMHLHGFSFDAFHQVKNRFVVINMGHGSTLCSCLHWARSRPHYESVFQKSEHMVRVSGPINNIVLVPRNVPKHNPTKAWLFFDLLQGERRLL